MDRFWAKVSKSGPVMPGMTSRCWAWTGATQKSGYGRIRTASGKLDGAHRVSWSMHNGLIPEGKLVLHKCDNPACVRPNHLYLGTYRDNAQDMAAKGRSWFQLHPEAIAAPKFGLDNPAAKLTQKQVNEIRASRLTQKVLAETYGVGQAQICRIRNHQQR